MGLFGGDGGGNDGIGGRRWRKLCIVLSAFIKPALSPVRRGVPRVPSSKSKHASVLC